LSALISAIDVFSVVKYNQNITFSKFFVAFYSCCITV